MQHLDDLREGLRRYQDLLLLAPPGGGKTTALWRLALDLAQEGLSDPGQPLPVFVRLGGLDQGTTLETLLRRELTHATLYDARKRPIALPAHGQLAALLPDLLASGRLVLLWDGLNETPTTLFGATARRLRSFATATHAPCTGATLASPPVALKISRRWPQLTKTQTRCRSSRSPCSVSATRRPRRWWSRAWARSVGASC